MRHSVALLMGLALPSLASLPMAFGEPTKPETQTFESLEQIREALGPKIAEQIPGYFNHRSHVLIYFPLERKEASELLLLEARRSTGQPYLLRHTLSPSKYIVGRRERGHLTLTVYHDRPCETGMAPQRDWLATCRTQAAAAERVAERQLVLVAIPRKSLKKLRITARAVPPRP